MLYRFIYALYQSIQKQKDSYYYYHSDDITFWNTKLLSCLGEISDTAFLDADYRTGS